MASVSVLRARTGRMRRLIGIATWSTALLAGLVSSVNAAKETKAPPLPAPEVRLSIEPRPLGSLWRMEVSNQGTAPLRLVADARLLRFEIVPPATVPSVAPKKGAPKPKEPASIICELPSSMREDSRTLSLPPGGKYIEAFDPRMFCLGASNKIESGATVIARLGWAPPKQGKLDAPFAVAPVSSGSSVMTLAAAKEIAAAPLVLDSKTLTAVVPIPSTSASTSASAKPLPKPAPLLEVKGGAAHSAALGNDVSVTIVVSNTSKETRMLYARPQLVSARIRGPHGDVSVCEGPPITPAPIIDFVVTLAPGGSWTATVPLAKLCPQGTLDRAGLYEVTPILNAPPIAKVPKAVTGKLAATTPQLLRIENGKTPYHDTPPLLVKEK